jgi:hypothetical protein
VRFVALVFAVVLASGLGGCLRDPYVAGSPVTSSNWRIDRQTDRITAAPVSSSQLFTANGSHSGEPYAKPASIQLMCFENKPVVRFAFEFKIGSDKNTFMGYRFDDKPGRDNAESRVLYGQQMIVIEERAAVAQFVADMAGSSSLYVRIRSLTNGRTTAEFKLDGSDAAVQTAYADCPIAPDPAPARRTS